MTKPPTCKKVPHTGTGYLHDEDDDSPYDVDGVMYCGRCHFAMDFHRDAPKPKEPSAEPVASSSEKLPTGASPDFLDERMNYASYQVDHATMEQGRAILAARKETP